MPETLTISKTNDTPEVILDPVAGKFELSCRSYPEDAVGFYSPVLEWLAGYSFSPNPATEFRFNLEYFNTASAKQLFKILILLQELSSKSNVKVTWCHHSDDADMLAAGERFSKLVSGIKFEVCKL